MLNKCIISKRANIDMEEIGDFIAIENKKAASKLIDKFYSIFERLTKMPQSGYIRTDWTIAKDIRFCNVKKYIIVYQVNEKNITILRVLSSYRDFTGFLD